MLLRKRVAQFLTGAVAYFTLVSFGFAQPTGTARLDGVVTETSTGHTMVLKLDAAQFPETTPGPHQDDHVGGGGHINAVLWGLSGLPMSACSVLAGAGVPNNIDSDRSGIFPLTRIECARAFGQTVSVDGCIVKTSFHGYSHSDNPKINFVGPVTIDITIQKTQSKVSVDLAVHTPKGPIQVSGQFTGTTQISSCQ